MATPARNEGGLKASGYRPVVVGAGLLAASLMGAVAGLDGQRAPLPGPTQLAPEILSLACAPSFTFEVPLAPLRVTGGQDATVRDTHSPGDLISVNAGIDHGLDVGHEFYTRRLVTTNPGAISRDNPATIQTTGWIRIYAVDRQMALATITHPCDTVDVGDYLEPFVLPVVPTEPSLVQPEAQRENYGRILVGSDRRRSFGRGDFFIVDRGSDHGVAVGTGFVVYRDKRTPETFLFELGEAVAIDVRPESSTLRATVTRDAFTAGDYVALRK